MPDAEPPCHMAMGGVSGDHKAPAKPIAAGMMAMNCCVACLTPLAQARVVLVAIDGRASPAEPGAVTTVRKLSVGGIRDFRLAPSIKLCVGGLISGYDIPTAHRRARWRSCASRLVRV